MPTIPPLQACAPELRTDCPNQHSSHLHAACCLHQTFAALLPQGLLLQQLQSTCYSFLFCRFVSSNCSCSCCDLCQRVVCWSLLWRPQQFAFGGCQCWHGSAGHCGVLLGRSLALLRWDNEKHQPRHILHNRHSLVAQCFLLHLLLAKLAEPSCAQQPNSQLACLFSLHMHTVHVQQYPCALLIH
jgi:hypothetical protein